jgi:hypothetical protein
MSLLDSVAADKRKRPRRILLYGTRGIGKSTFGAMAPNPVFIPTEDGLEHISCKAFFSDRAPPICQTYGEVIACIAELYQAPHEFKTVVIDSLDWLERLVIDETCRRQKAQSLDELNKRSYGKGYDFTLPLWRDILSGLDALRNERGMTIIFISHFTTEKVRQPDTDTFTRYSPKLHKESSDMVQEWCDEVLFASYKVFTTTIDEGFGRERAKGIGTGERILKTTERPTHLAKNRLSLPDEMPLDWREYAKHYEAYTAA